MFALSVYLVGAALLGLAVYAAFGIGGLIGWCLVFFLATGAAYQSLVEGSER